MITGGARMIMFVLLHPSAQPPSGTLYIRVPGAPRGMQITQLEGIAAAYRTEVTKRFGALVAERKFGPLTVEAHVEDEDYSAQLAARMGTEAAA
jgi:hypothetical protein